MLFRHLLFKQNTMPKKDYDDDDNLNEDPFDDDDNWDDPTDPDDWEDEWDDDERDTEPDWDRYTTYRKEDEEDQD